MEAKLALKQLKLIKKQLSAIKRQATQSQRLIRAQYTHEVRQRGSKVRGGGSLGSFFRTIQTISRDSRRSQLATDLVPLEEQKAKAEAILAALEQAILQIEMHILHH